MKLLIGYYLQCDYWKPMEWGRENVFAAGDMDKGCVCVYSLPYSSPYLPYSSPYLSLPTSLTPLLSPLLLSLPFSPSFPYSSPYLPLLSPLLLSLPPSPFSLTPLSTSLSSLLSPLLLSLPPLTSPLLLSFPLSYYLPSPTAREITKKFEEFKRGTVSEIVTWLESFGDAEVGF